MTNSSPDSWSGQVDAKLATGNATGFTVRKGEVISITASGTAQRATGAASGPDGDEGYTSEGLLCQEAPVGSLVMKIGDQFFPVKSKLENWTVPVDGEITLFFNDKPNAFHDNKGAFEARIQRIPQTIWKGQLQANAEQGVGTGVVLKKGDALTIKVTGSARYKRGGELLGPNGTGTPSKNGFFGASVLGRIGGETVQVGEGLERWAVPADGELSFIYNDFNQAGFMRDNEGSFDIVVEKH